MIRCFLCGGTPDQLDEYVEGAQAYGISPDEYVRSQEGTYNRKSGLFACTACYVAMGSPERSRGWKAPDQSDLGSCPRCEKKTFTRYHEDVDVGVGIQRCDLNGGYCYSCGVLACDPRTDRWTVMQSVPEER